MIPPWGVSGEALGDSKRALAQEGSQKRQFRREFVGGAHSVGMAHFRAAGKPRLRSRAGRQALRPAQSAQSLNSSKANRRLPKIAAEQASTCMELEETDLRAPFAL